MVRWLALIFALTAIVVSLGACGNTSRVTTGATARGSANEPRATSRGGGATGASKGPTKAQAVAFASAVNLTSADVPGFAATSKREHKRETTAEKRVKRQLQSCTGGSVGSRNTLVEASSMNFELQRHILDFSVSSQVSVSRTPTLAGGELSAIRGNHVRACLSHYVDALLKEQFLKQKPGSIDPNSISTKVTEGTPPAPGATGSFAWLITASVGLHGIRIPLYVDILGFIDGPSEVSLLSSGILRPFPASAQEHLYRLLLARAEEHRLS